MAKLSAHGTELARVYKITSGNPDTDLWFNTKDTIALMSDGYLMTKHDGYTKSPYAPNGIEFHSWGWKRGKKVKTTKELFESYFVQKGYIIDKD